MNAPHKARIAQTQNRHQPHQVAHHFVNIVQRQRLASTVDKAAQRHDAVIIGQFAFQAIKNALIAILAGYPAIAQRTETAHPMMAGLILAEGQDDMQMMFTSLDIARRKPEIIAHEVIELKFRRKQ